MRVILIAYEGLKHLVTLLDAHAAAKLGIRQLIKEVVCDNANQGIVSPVGVRQMNFKWSNGAVELIPCDTALLHT